MSSIIQGGVPSIIQLNEVSCTWHDGVSSTLLGHDGVLSTIRHDGVSNTMIGHDGEFSIIRHDGVKYTIQ